MSEQYKIIATLEDRVSWAPINNPFSASYAAWKVREDANLLPAFLKEQLDRLAVFATEQGDIRVAKLAKRFGQDLNGVNASARRERDWQRTFSTSFATREILTRNGLY